MTNRINPYHHAQLNLYSRVDGPSSAQPTHETEAAQESSAPQAEPSAKLQQAEGLTQEERQMIQRYFPESPTMSLRLYGPNRSEQTVNPGAVGSRLDVRG